jgi:hypothetical protein
MTTTDLAKRCGNCARFVRVHEIMDENGEVRRRGECLLGVWQPPLYETNTCSQHVTKGTFKAHTAEAHRSTRTPRVARGGGRSSSAGNAQIRRLSPEPLAISLPQDLLDMDAEEFRSVLREVLSSELAETFGAPEVELGGRWSGGEIILKPGKTDTAEKRLSIESFFHKIVMLRDKLRVLEQKLNAHPQLSDEDKVQMQQYITGCYGTLTTFNVLFAAREDGFVGAAGAGKGDKED